MAVDLSMPVLVVDDYNTMIRIIRNLLKQIGFQDIDDAVVFQIGDDVRRIFVKLAIPPGRGVRDLASVELAFQETTRPTLVRDHWNSDVAAIRMSRAASAPSPTRPISTRRSNTSAIIFFSSRPVKGRASSPILWGRDGTPIQTSPPMSSPSARKCSTTTPCRSSWVIR